MSPIMSEQPPKKTANRNRYTRIRVRRPAESEEGSFSGVESEDAVKEIPAGGKRGVRRMKKMTRTLMRLGIVAAVIIMVLTVWVNHDSIAPDGVVYFFKDIFASRPSGENFPIQIAGGTVTAIQKTSGGAAMLTDTSFIIYDTGGTEIIRRQHGFARPFLRTSGRWSLLADLDGTGLRIETRGSTRINMTMQHYILSASVNSNGEFAVVTTSTDGYAAEVTVFDRKGTEYYRWRSPELRLTDVELNDNGKTMIATGFTGEGGAMKSSLLYFDFSRDKPTAVLSDTDILMFHAAFMSGGKIAAVGDTGVWITDKNGSTPQKTGFDDHVLVGYSISSNQITTVLRHYGNTDGGLVTAVNSRGEKLFTHTFAGDYRNIAPCDDGAYLLTSHSLYRTGVDKLTPIAGQTRDGEFVCELGKHPIVVGLTKISRY